MLGVRQALCNDCFYHQPKSYQFSFGTTKVTEANKRSTFEFTYLLPVLGEIFEVLTR